MEKRNDVFTVMVGHWITTTSSSTIPYGCAKAEEIRH
jgi:hypothetical protein